MAQSVCILLNPNDRQRLEQIAGNRKRFHTPVQRVNIVLLSDDRLPVLEVAHRANVSRTAV